MLVLKQVDLKISRGKAFSLVEFPICEHRMLSNSAYNQLKDASHIF